MAARADNSTLVARCCARPRPSASAGTTWKRAVLKGMTPSTPCRSTSCLAWTRGCWLGRTRCRRSLEMRLQHCRLFLLVSRASRGSQSVIQSFSRLPPRSHCQNCRCCRLLLQLRLGRHQQQRRQQRQLEKKPSPIRAQANDRKRNSCSCAPRLRNSKDTSARSSPANCRQAPRRKASRTRAELPPKRSMVD